MANSTEESLSHTHFLLKVHHSHLMLKDTRQDFSTTLGGGKRNSDHQDKAQKFKKHGTKYTKQRTPVQSMNLETKGQSTSLTSAGNMHRG